MSDFIVKSLNLVADITMGQSPDSKSVNEKGIGLPFFQGNADFGKKSPTPKEWCVRPKKIANIGDILLSVRAPVGAINLADVKSCIGRGLAAITAKTIPRDYLYYYISNFSYELTKREQGSTFKAINRGDLDCFNISYPNTQKKQHKIAEILLTVDAVISQTEETIAKLQKIKAGLMQDLFIRGIDSSRKLRPTYEEKPEIYKSSPLGMIPKEWEIKCLKDVVNIVGRIGFRGYTVEDLVPEGRGALSLSPSNINHNKLVFSDNTFISWNKYYESPEIMIEEKDIIFVKTGSTIGKVCIVESQKWKMTINPQMVIFKNNKLDPHFLYYYFGYSGFFVGSAGRMS